MILELAMEKGTSERGTLNNGKEIFHEKADRFP